MVLRNIVNDYTVIHLKPYTLFSISTRDKNPAGEHEDHGVNTTVAKSP